ncbi:MAG TPA: glycerate kinase [Syntrophales bacterium]|nr:glycerate kinase [Syntrophales bacterium]
MDDDAVTIFNAALGAVDPYAAVKSHVEKIRKICREEGLTKIFVVGLGKAAYPMTRSLVDAFRDRIAGGVVVTKYGHAPGGTLSENIAIFEAGHPVPDENGVAGASRAVELLKTADRETLVVCLISGGGSALFVAPADGLSLDDKQVMTRILLRGGADIVELNTVRKHLSRVKAGRLAEAASPARVISLILSDVIGDPLDFIASGPTSPDTTTWADALSIVTRYDTAGEMPQNILQLLRDGSEGKIPDTPKKGDPVFDRVENIIIGSNRIATEAARQEARDLGYEPVVLTTELQGEARDAARWLYRQLLESQSCLTSGRKRIALIAGGESTVTVRGKGLGGRNTEMALAFAMDIAGTTGITFLSAGTDGTDGPTDAAGAIVDGQTLSKARALDLDPQAFLDDNDSYHFFEKVGGLVKTGPTGTNVMDLQIILIE